MHDTFKPKWGIRVDKREDGMWCFGIGLSHFVKETYLYINFYRRSIAIGYLYDFEDDWIDEF